MAVSIVFNNNRELILDRTTLNYVDSRLKQAIKLNQPFMTIKNHNIRVDHITWVKEVKQ